MSIEGIHIQPPQYGLTPVTHISHVPVAESALLSSLTTLVGSGSPDDSNDEGYMHWKSAYNNGNAGVFSIPVAEIINTIERSIHPLH